MRQLAADLRVNFNTIARAYRLLDEAGLISTQHGRGTYVWKTPSEETVRTLRQQSLQEQIQHFLRELIRRGYSPAEIGEEFKKGLMSEKENMT